MQKSIKTFYRSAAFFLALILLTAGLLAALAPKANAAKITKNSKKYEIAVVYDNSGSMYMPYTNGMANKSWCRAKYAMEIFASMLDYKSGDHLKIFPMHEVAVGKGGSRVDSLDIKSIADIDKIHNMFTPSAGGTPFATVGKAYDYLKNAGDKNTERWLLVLTDGEFSGGSAANIADLAGGGIKVQYLGFEAADQVASNPAKGFYSKISTGEQIQNDLIDICNIMFQRSVLPADKLSGGNLTLDISMKKLIVFAQGDSAKISSITDSAGTAVSRVQDSKTRTYSDICSGNHPNAAVDNTLAGQVVTFGAAKAGTYKLDCSGADKIQVFYEPDVDIEVIFTNSSGEKLDPAAGDKLTEGDYTVNYAITDNVTGADVSNSQLLGKVDWNSAVVINGKETPLKNGGKVSLAAGETTYVKISGTYLDDYTISTEDNKDAYTFKIEKPPENKLEINSEVLQTQSWYTLSDSENWEPIKVTFKNNGKDLTPAEFEAMEFEVTSSEKLPFRVVKDNNELAYYIYVGQDDEGKYTEPKEGSYDLKLNASLTDKLGREATASEEEGIEVSSQPWWLKLLIILAALVLLIILIILFLNMKVLPKMMKEDNTVFRLDDQDETVEGIHANVKYSKKGKSLTVSTPNAVEPFEARSSATFKLKAVDKRITPSRKRGIGIIGISSNAYAVSIGSVQYEKDEEKGYFRKVGTLNNGKPPVIDQTAYNPNIVIKAGEKDSPVSTLTCKLKTK